MNSRYILKAYDFIHRAHEQQYSCQDVSQLCFCREDKQSEKQMSSSWTEPRKQHISSEDLNWILHVKLKYRQITVPKVFCAAARGTWLCCVSCELLNYLDFRTSRHTKKSFNMFTTSFCIKCITLQPTITTTTKEKKRKEKNRTNNWKELSRKTILG